MDEALIESYRTTDYWVCLDITTWVKLRVDEPLPAGLDASVGDRPWAFITAWNPRSQPRDHDSNLAAQRDLLLDLRQQSETSVFPGIGAGNIGWQEPSLFVIGPAPEALDALALRYSQNAYLFGRGKGIVMLRLLHN